MKLALTTLFSLEYFLRKGNIVVHRGPLILNSETGKEEFDQEICFKGRVMDRVYPGGKYLSSLS